MQRELAPSIIKIHNCSRRTINYTTQKKDAEHTELFWQKINKLKWPECYFDNIMLFQTLQLNNDLSWLPQFKIQYNVHYDQMLTVLRLSFPEYMTKSATRGIVSHTIALGKEMYYIILNNPEIYHQTIVEVQYKNLDKKLDEVYHYVRQ